MGCGASHGPKADIKVVEASPGTPERAPDAVAAPESAADRVRRLALDGAGPESLSEAWARYLQEELLKPRMSILKVVDPTQHGNFLPVDKLLELCTPGDKARIERLLETVPSHSPRSLSDFGYNFDESLCLRRCVDSKASGTSDFEFVGERHYETLCDFVVADVQRRMTSDEGMQRFSLLDHTADRIDHSDAAGSLDIFVSQALLDELHGTDPISGMKPASSLLIIIPGSGQVRPGIWARGPCVNESLVMGSMLPTIHRAHQAGLAVIVCNPNQQRPELPPAEAETRAGHDRSYFVNPGMPERVAEVGGVVKGCESSESHVLTVWDRVVAPWLAKSRSKASRHVALLAHSAGGLAALALVRERGPALQASLRCVAFTDAAHDVRACRYGAGWEAFFSEHARDWVSSAAPLDNPEPSSAFDDCVPRVSAGTTKHERTSGCAEESFWHFIVSKLESATASREAAAAGTM